MDKNILRACVINKDRGTYPLLVRSYRNEAQELTPTLFAKFVARTLELDLSMISIPACKLAMKNFKTQNTSTPNQIKSTNEKGFNTEIPDQLEGFK